MESPWDETPKFINTQQEAEWSRMSSEFTNVYHLSFSFLFYVDGETRQAIVKESRPERRVLSRRALIQVLQMSVLQLVEN